MLLIETPKLFNASMRKRDVAVSVRRDVSCGTGPLLYILVGLGEWKEVGDAQIAPC